MSESILQRLDVQRDQMPKSFFPSRDVSGFLIPPLKIKLRDTKWYSCGHGHFRACRTGRQSLSSQRSYLFHVEQIAQTGASQPTTFASTARRLSHQFLSLVWFGPSRPQFKHVLNKGGIVLISHVTMLDVLAVLITPHSLCRWFRLYLCLKRWWRLWCTFLYESGTIPQS